MSGSLTILREYVTCISVLVFVLLSDGKSTRSPSLTLAMANAPNVNKTVGNGVYASVGNLTKASRSTNVTATVIGVTSKVVAVNVSSSTVTLPQPASKDPLPLPILIASSVCAVALFIFVCVTYKCHAVQLDAEAKKKQIQLAVGTCPSPCLPCTPRRSNSQKVTLISPTRSNSDSDFTTSSHYAPVQPPRQKGLPHQTPLLLAPQGSLDHRRGSRSSNFSAKSDQDIIVHASPRRHSTFIL